MADVELAEIDPVCGMKVLPEKAAASVHACRPYLVLLLPRVARQSSKQTRANSTARSRSLGIHRRAMIPASAQYTCPMHPEVLSPKPGPCPKCGMALEPTRPIRRTEHIQYTCPMHPQIVRDEPGHMSYLRHGA